jgi:nucleoid-associated protein YgaU
MKRLIKGLAALVALAAAVGGIPWMLLRYGHWPITSLPTMAWVRHLNDRFVSDRTIVSVLTVAVWLVWAAFAYSVIIELAAALRGAKAPHISLAGPLQSMARGLVAAIVVTVSINHGSTSLAATMPAGLAVPRVPVAALVHGAPMTPMRSTVLTRSVDVRPTVRVETTPTRLAAVPLDVSVPRTVVVERNDSPWLIAERCLGDGMRWRELWDLNRGVTQADGRAWTDQQVLLQGWTLALPRTGVADAVDEQKSGSTIYVVVKGDTLSDIAEDELGNERLYPEIFDASRTIDQPDGRHLSDPNLILPGWKLSIPSHLQHPAPTAPVPSVPLPTAAVAVPAPPLPPSTTLPPPSGDAADPTLPPPSVVSSTAVTNPLPNTVVPVSIAPVTSAPPATTVARSGTRSGGSYIALLAAVGGSIALASGLAIRIGLLRRRRRTNSGTRRPKAEVHEPDIRTILRAADIPLVRWAGQELAQLVGDLKRADITAGPQAVELSGASGIEVLWSDPQQHAPERWQIADGGWAWRLPYDPEAPSPANSLPSAIPALVTIGIREGRQLLIDLEAFGSIAVNGPADMVDGFLRSVAVELATDQDLADAYVQVVGLDVPATRFERLTTTDIDEAVAELDGIRKSIADAMSVSHIDSTFVARVASDTPLEVTVAVIGTASPDGQIEPVPARSGVAVIGIGHAIEAACRIELSADGTARIEPLGITFVPARLTIDASDAIDNVFVELRNLAVEIDDVALVIAEAVPPEAVSGESDEQESAVCHEAELDLAPIAMSRVDLLDRASRNLPYAGSMDTVVNRPLGGDGDGIAENASALHLNRSHVNGQSIGGEVPTLPFDPSDPPAEDERAGPQMVVKVLGVPCVPDRPNLGHREVVMGATCRTRCGKAAQSNRKLCGTSSAAPARRSANSRTGNESC